LFEPILRTIMYGPQATGSSTSRLPQIRLFDNKQAFLIALMA